MTNVVVDVSDEYPNRRDNNVSVPRRARRTPGTSQLLFLTIIVRISILSIAYFASYLPLFDSSAAIIFDRSPSLVEHPFLQITRRAVETFLRWDALHFLHIAREAYLSEYQYAFFPGVPFILYMGGNAISLLSTPSPYQMLASHFIISTLITYDTIRTLYHLTFLHTGSPQIALLTSCLSLLSSSPATLHLAPYAEPWFAWASYRGMLYCAKHQWFLACCAFALAGLFRSNAILLAGFILWGMLVEPFLTNKRIPCRNLFFAPFFALPPAVPFIYHQWKGFKAFCTPPLLRPWCSNRLPLIYSFVQSHYWDVGFLRYWTIQQLPNFLLAAPVLALLSWGSVSFLQKVAFSTLHVYSKPVASRRVPQSLLSLSLLPHAIHALILSLILLFAAHTQIILRFASCLPFTYWSAARLFFEHPKYAKMWVVWSSVWGSVSVVLWVAFLPPA